MIHPIPTRCPYCHAEHTHQGTTVNHQDEHAPKDGDLIFCIQCGEFGAFVAFPPSVRILRDGEWLALPQSYREQLHNLKAGWQHGKYLLARAASRRN